MFFIQKNSEKTAFTLEASGIKKLALLWKLLRNGLLEKGSILFWDEPENSLNPELMSLLVDILLELSRNGVQVFIATHSEILASYFAVNRQNDKEVLFISLYKDGESIKADADERFDLLRPNNLTAEPVKLYEKELEKGLGSA
jgi:predicted ATPase